MSPAISELVHRGTQANSMTQEGSGSRRSKVSRRGGEDLDQCDGPFLLSHVIQGPPVKARASKENPPRTEPRRRSHSSCPRRNALTSPSSSTRFHARLPGVLKDNARFLCCQARIGAGPGGKCWPETQLSPEVALPIFLPPGLCELELYKATRASPSAVQEHTGRRPQPPIPALPCVPPEPAA
uniref:Uncharacterized protein n=1 Tax=Myotis myotis TaxID=51298 RepID=A0A7J7RMN2_MYOMY|nr:hypothetical protein mMyoMyo1_010258 [Myotis myotis]